jgi:single-strand DNA-binding protein
MKGLAMYNKIVLAGNLVQDPDVINLPDQSMVKIRVATNFGRGEKKETEYFNVKMFGKLADTCKKFLTKGKAVIVEGRVQTRTHEGKSYVEVLADDVRFI